MFFTSIVKKIASRLLIGHGAMPGQVLNRVTLSHTGELRTYSYQE